MTVAELIEKLKQFPQDHEIVVAGYEGNYDKNVDAFPIRVEKEKTDKWTGDWAQVKGEANAVVIE